MHWLIMDCYNDGLFFSQVLWILNLQSDLATEAEILNIFNQWFNVNFESCWRRVLTDFSDVVKI